MSDVKAPAAPTTINIGKEELKALLSELMNQPKRMSPLEERRYKEELDAEERRNKMITEMARIEAEAMRIKRDQCSHKRNDAGDAVATSDASGFWTTSGQLHSNDIISLICVRCSTVWCFHSTPQERDFVNSSAHGLLGSAPPPKERLLTDISKA